jgi:predicted enzyme related to lactoylglutathione lyase
MAIEVLALTIDCADASRLAQFWAEALGRTVNPGATAAKARIAATDAAKTGPLLSFQKVPEGKTVKNRVHLDLGTTQMEAETERLLALGATKLWDAEKGGTRWTTFADPEGNEFDLIAR